ncbi:MULTISPECIES: acetyl-CoA hydrolase/transferase C-terminal domain-containing protein [unclassified Roseovarius]|uniref:acetyl-CoA hydrolase/transferase C-terminal domain-containing protein n=1 Tax=unclassified Roseovarius TaxID=2614913 RepID=UPI00273E15D4|nr:acetyl-CoA hydrolase/transferase C-terminal domain-containing protein [Roseovarius sp. MMSF_3350]
MAERPEVHTDADAMARATFDATGGEIRLALPLGLGKPVTFVNALVRAAVEDPSLTLKIFTALSLQRPEPSSDLEARFLNPAMDRLFGAAPSLAYVDLIKGKGLPDNIEVSEFFFQAGSWLGNDYAQRQYISANYTHARDVLVDQNPNVLAQLMPRQGDRFSMSCNTDISADLFACRAAGEMDFIAVAEINDALPFMDGPAALDAGEVAMVLDPPEQIDLFSVLRRPVGDAQHAIALHVSRLVPDGGTLQIGIGAIGDAVANALIARDRAALHALWRDAPLPLQGVEEEPFRTGLYAVTEMLVGGLVALFEADILRREVDGAVIHAGFFVDARDMYERLRALPPDRRAKIRMMPVSYTNALYGDEAAKRAARQDARFVNGAMQVSLLGDAMSDAAKPGQVVSGVGGQFNFFEQAFALKDAHAVLTLPATRQSGGDLTSNIVWQLPVTTVPRHMRDIVVTEYGAAFLRGLPDEEVIKRLICIADSRFQPDLAEKARKAGKLDPAWTIPEAHRRNTPDTIADWLAPHRDGLLPDYPLGTDFTETEKLLVKALSRLREAARSKPALLSLVWSGLTASPHPQEGAAMERMGYGARPQLAEPLQARALRGALRQLG